MRAYFVSDLHLISEDDPRTKKFVAFLDQLIASPPTHLFLVGDIFDLWIGDHAYFRKKFGSVSQRIQKLIALETEVHFFEGNHDLHLEKFWRRELGVEVHREAAYFHLGEKIVRIEHGDQMNPDDKGYLFLRWFLRTPGMRWLSQSLPGFLVSAIGERASSVSRHHTSTAKELPVDKIRSIIRDHAAKAYSEKPFDLIISGHVHVVDDYDFAIGSTKIRSVNLGAWFDSAKVFELTNESGKFLEI